MLPDVCCEACVLPVIRISAPMAPQKMPSTFFEVTGSRRNSAASTMVMMGIIVVMMLALTGDVRLSPMV